MALFDSSIETENEYAVDPAALASACQDVLKQMGLRVKGVSRESGIIRARTPMFGLGGEKYLTLTIGKSDNGSSMKVQISVNQGVFSGGACQKFMAEFLSNLSAHPAMKNKSSAGW